MDASTEDARGIARKLRVNWDQASAHRLKRVLMADERPNKRRLDSEDEVVGQCEVRQASDEVTHPPAAGASSVTPFDEKLQVDFLFLDDVAASRAMDMCSKQSAAVWVCSKNALEVWGTFAEPWGSVFAWTSVRNAILASRSTGRAPTLCWQGRFVRWQSQPASG